MSRLRLDRLQGDAGATPKGPNEEDCGGARRANRATVREILGKSWGNLVEILGKSWGNLGEIL